jgi:hypothetical protein
LISPRIGIFMEVAYLPGMRNTAFDPCIPTKAAKVPTGGVDPRKSTTATCACRKLNPGILVMQPAQDWATKNVPGAIDGAREGCILLQG